LAGHLAAGYFVIATGPVSGTIVRIAKYASTKMAPREKLKTALDETRLLILGSQVLFGFQFNAMFLEGFDELSRVGRGFDAFSFCLMAVVMGLLIAPSMQHRLVEAGHDSNRIHEVTTRFAAFAMVPFSLSIGLTFYVVMERHGGAAIASLAGSLFFAAAIFFWFGIGHLIERPETLMVDSMDDKTTPLGTRIDHMLTEARVLLPGAQAMLGFQFAIMLAKPFDQLPPGSKLVHIVALTLIAMAVILLMTPAAIHRLTFKGQDTESFHRIGSRFVIGAAVPLGLGISADIYVAVTRALETTAAGLISSMLAITFFAVLWFVQPLLLRERLS
jgi:hypothetical protein